jgi:hypothetical protein
MDASCVIEVLEFGEFSLKVDLVPEKNMVQILPPGRTDKAFAKWIRYGSVGYRPELARFITKK